VWIFPVAAGRIARVPHEFPEAAILATGDFLLRPPDVAEYREVLGLGLDPDVRLWNPRCQITDEADAIEDCLAGADWSDGSHATFSIIHRDTGRYAGNIALHGIDPDTAQAKIGYRVARWARGQGLATRALDIVATWAMAQRLVRCIVLTHAVENAASCRVAHKSGFRLERLLPANKRFGDGLVHDEHLHIRDARGTLAT
jgi:RimJ/RimL family protein N-acetyltransferase